MSNMHLNVEKVASSMSPGQSPSPGLHTSPDGGVIGFNSITNYLIQSTVCTHFSQYLSSESGSSREGIMRGAPLSRKLASDCAAIIVCRNVWSVSVHNQPRNAACHCTGLRKSGTSFFGRRMDGGESSSGSTKATINNACSSSLNGLPRHDQMLLLRFEMRRR